MIHQNSLGGRRLHRFPDYSHHKVARIVNTEQYKKYGKVEAIFIDYSQPTLIWVFNDTDREPTPGDMILVGYLDNRKDSPYMKGFLRNKSYTSNFINIERESIRVQLPFLELATEGGKAETDIKENLLEDSKKEERAYVELTKDSVILSYPTSEDGSTAPAKVILKASETLISHPTSIKINSPVLKFNSPDIEFIIPVEGYSDARVKFDGSGFLMRHPTSTLTVQKKQDLPSPQPETVTL